MMLDYMPEVFRKNYSYGETIPIIGTYVGMTADIYVPDKAAPAGPYLKAIFVATAGPVTSMPAIVEPLDNDSKVIRMTDVPVPIPSARSVDLSLRFDIANYRWTPALQGPRENGTVTFDLRLQAAFWLLGESQTLVLDERSCSITLLKQLPPMQKPK
jgi:hypothetical protein